MKKVKITILAIAMLQMISSGLSAALSSLQEAFPNSSALKIQLLLSCIGIIVLFMSLVTDRLYACFTRRRCVIAALVLMVAVGALAYFYHPSLTVLYLYSALLGISIALYIPAVGSVIMDCFTGEARASLTGQQSAFCSMGGIVISFLGGLLAAEHWYATYLVFLLAIPALILTVLFFPKDTPRAAAQQAGNKQPEKKGPMFSPAIFAYGGICLAFLVIYSGCGSNLSMFVAEEGLGTTVLSGALGSIGMAGGVVGGILFSRVLSCYRERLFPAIFAMLTLSFAALVLCRSIGLLAVIVFVMGCVQCVMMPCCLLTLSDEVQPYQTVLVSSVICAVAPNLSGVISPLIITNLSEVLFRGSVRGRFIIAGILALGMTAVMTVLTLRKKKCA